MPLKTFSLGICEFIHLSNSLSDVWDTSSRNTAVRFLSTRRHHHPMTLNRRQTLRTRPRLTAIFLFHRKTRTSRRMPWIDGLQIQMGTLFRRKQKKRSGFWTLQRMAASRTSSISTLQKLLSYTALSSVEASRASCKFTNCKPRMTKKRLGEIW
jgi:hypothetical protein